MANKEEVESNPVAVITGGTTGIGGATARELARRGYRLYLTGLEDPDDLLSDLKSSGASVDFLQIDLAASESAARTIIAGAFSRFGRIDLLVNCAGTISYKDPALISDGDWEKIFAINLKAPFFLIQQALPYLKLSQGSVINVSSTNAIHPMKKNQLYDSLKAALNNLTQGLALEYRDFGVRVNAVMPGGVQTPLTEMWLINYLGKAPTSEDYDIPSLAQPEQIAKVIASLAHSDMAWVNGVTLPVDGGFVLG
jgi:NAD(P)-dependent dehydrogenase (short-subunit alcohol dehydrogenase family)